MANSIRLQYQICLSHSRTPPPQIQLANLQELFPVRVPVLVMGLAKRQGQVPCPIREHSPHECLVVSDLKPAPRPIPRSRNWFQIRHHQVNLARTGVTDFRTSWPRIWPNENAQRCAAEQRQILCRAGTTRTDQRPDLAGQGDECVEPALAGEKRWQEDAVREYFTGT